MLGGYTFIRYNGNLTCIISVPLTLCGHSYSEVRENFLVLGLTRRAVED